MATPNEITTTIATRLNKVLDIPFRLSLMVRVDALRARFIKDTLERSPRDRKFFLQTIYVPMEKKSYLECCNMELLCDAAVSPKLPSSVRANGIKYDFVGSIDGSKRFVEGASDVNMYMSAGKYSGGRVSFEDINNRIIIKSKPNLPKIRVDGIFENTESLAEFICQDENGGCDYWNMEYPCTAEILALIYKEMDASFAQQQTNTPKDQEVNPIDKTNEVNG